MAYLATRHLVWEDVKQALLAANWWMLAPYFGVMAVQHVFRSWRWCYLLAPIHPVPFQRVLPISSVGFLAIAALPLRMGEFVRPYLIADPPRISMSQGMGTMAVERVFDGLVLSSTAFVAVALAMAQGKPVPHWVFVSGIVALSLFLVGLVVLVMTLWKRQQAVTLCRALVGIFSKGLADRAAAIASGIVDGFVVLPDWRRLVPFVTNTIIYWGLNAVAFWITGAAFDLELSLLSSVGVMALVGIGIMIPAGPGFFGNFELFADGALALYVSEKQRRSSGAAFVLTTHVANLAWYAFAGTLGLVSKHVTWSRVMQATDLDGSDSSSPETASNALTKKMDTTTHASDTQL